MKCFEALSLTPSATPDEVKTAWRALATIHHPDKGGDPAEFSRLRKAYGDALREASAPKPCTKCHGTKRIKRVNGWTSIDLPCDHCGGAGDEP